MVQFMSRHDVEDCQPGDPRGVIERHTVADTPAAVVPHHGKLLEAEVVHDFYLILGRGALGVTEMVVTIRRFATVAIAAEIGDHHGEILGQPRRDLMPPISTLMVAPWVAMVVRVNPANMKVPLLFPYGRRVRSQQTCVK